jgi:hypothetical protein
MTKGLRSFKGPAAVGSPPARPAPTFSVVIAAHNAEGTIAEAIESALGQTHAPVELIVCDDGSTDGTAAALESYRDRITYLRKQQGGVASARNAALEIASGEFFAVLDADDVYRPERIEALAQLALARPDLDILCTDAVFELDGRTFGSFSAACPFEILDQKAAILERCFCIAPAVRRTTLVAVGGFDDSLRTGSDWECAIRLVHAGAGAGLVEEPLYEYRVHGQSLTSGRILTLRDRVGFLERIGESYDLTESERASLDRSLAAQRKSLVLAEAEAALRSHSPDARSRALAAARTRGLTPRARAAAIAAAIAPRVAGRALDRRAEKNGGSRLARSLPDGPRPD